MNEVGELALVGCWDDDGGGGGAGGAGGCKWGAKLLLADGCSCSSCECWRDWLNEL